MIQKVFRQMLITQILSSLTVMICMFVDSVIIGRFLGVSAMTAYGLTNPILLAFAAFGSMLTAGIQVCCGKTMGRGDMEATNACFSTSLVYAGAVSVLGLVLVLVFSGPIATLLGAGRRDVGNEVFFLTKDYLTGFIIGAPAFLMAQIMVPYLQMGGKRTLVAVAVVAMTLGDIVFDLLNVFVFHGGTFGMGLASSLSYYIALAIGGSWFLKKNCLFNLRPRSVSLKLCRELNRNGMPTMVNQISVVLLVFLTNHVLQAVSSSLAVAAYSVISTLSNVCYCFGAGIGAVALMLSSVFYGDEDRNALISIVRTALKYGIVLGIVVMAVMLAGANRFAALFLSDSPNTTAMAAQGLRLFALSLPFSVIVTSMKNYYQGIGRITFSELLSFMQSFVFKAVFILLLSGILGTTGVWLSWLCGEAAALLLLLAVIWHRKNCVTVRPEAISLLPEHFGGTDSFQMVVRDLDGAIKVSTAAEKYCSERNLSARTAMLIGLCIEEMVSNIVEHGFTKDRQKDHSIDVRLSLENGETRIRIRDNCVYFDPVSYLKLHSTEDPVAHIGIRMVMRMVKEANYISALGLNNLTLVI